MPHSTSPSADTVQTFDLGIDDEDDKKQTVVEVDDEARPMSAHSKSSSAYGLAVTSTPSRDERKELPSQRSSIISSRRKSAPNSHTYADVMEQGGPVQQGAILRKDAQRENRRSASYNEESKRRSQHYGEYKNGMPGPSKDNAPRQSPIIAELKTNVIIKDEFTLVTDLTRHLAQRYQRPDACIMIKVDHSACLALGGNFDPCYILNIQALQSQMGASTNKRNAALIQSFMADILSVPSERGIVTFVAVVEENVAQNGRTVFDIMEKVEKSEVKKVAEATRKSMTFGKNGNPLLNGHTTSSSNLVAGSESSKSVTPEPQVAPAVNGLNALRDRASSANSKNGRPSTAHGASSGTFDGLRMNPVATDSVISDAGRTPNGRPKTIGAPEPAASVQEELKREPLPSALKSTSTASVPLVSRASSQPAPQPKPTKSEPKKSSITTTTTKSALSPLAPRPVQSVPKTTTTSTVTAPVTSPGPNRPKHTPLIPESRQKNTYLDNVSSLSRKGASPPSPTIVVTSSEDIPLKANTAKRRSTITATPKLPHHPPLPAEPIDTKSMSSRLSKRKSFLRMFKRNSIPAWYEQ